MPVAYPSGVPRLRPADLLVLAAVALLVLAGLAGAVPPLAVVALAGAAGSALAGARLSRLVVPARGGDPAGDDVARPGPWRGPRVRPAAGLLHAAVLSVGLTVAVLPLVAAGLRVAVGAAGLGLAAVLHTVGLLLLPGRT
ncbi:GGDEF domain-containing protein, partial [Micromonospora sp. DH15]|nr:GGDEF domain-containing protein [Micromonospora sp. DH15]